MFTHQEEMPSRILRPSSVYRYTPLRARDGQRRGRGEHLRVGMPQYGAVAVDRDSLKKFLQTSGGIERWRPSAAELPA